MTACHFLSRKYSDKSRTEAGTEGAETSDEYLQSRRKCFHFMSHLTSHINKMRTGEEAEREAEEDRLTFDRWWLVNPWGTTLPACTPWVTAPASPPPPPPFFFSVSSAVLSDKAPVSVRYVSFLLRFFSFFPLIAWQHLLDDSSSGEVVLKCCATLATSPAADPQAYRETNPFILPSTFRWGGGRLLHCFTSGSMLSLLIDVHILIWSAEFHLKEMKRKRSKAIGWQVSSWWKLANVKDQGPGAHR